MYILCPKEKEELNDLNDAIKKSANRIREALKIQQDNIQKNKEQNDRKIRLTQVQAQTKQFQKVWNEYNDSQLDFRKESKTTLIRQAKITGNIHFTDEKIEEMILHVAHYSGFPTAVSASQLLNKVWDEKKESQ